jgi:protein TonB
MRIEMGDKMRVWNLKIFFSVSLAIHLLILSIASILFPDFKIDRLPPLNIEVSLLPLISGAKSLPKVISSPAVKTQIKKEEKRQPSPLPVQAEAKVTHINDPPPPPSQIDEEKITRDSPDREMSISFPSETASTFKIEENLFPLKEAPKKREDFSIALPYFHPKELHGNPIPIIGSSEEPQIAMKNPSPYDGEIVFARPKYAENPKPHYPNEARKNGYQGEVILRVEVLSNGRVGQVEVKSSSGHEILDRSALTAVKQWRFIPANRGNGSIPCWVNIPIKFQLQ